MSNPASPRVLLVEDDASLQRFVALALDELGIELLRSSGVDAALALLTQQPVQLILTDLMMPGRSGFELIEALNAQPGLRGEARLVVFSAGLTPPVRQRLEGMQVWRLLSKPCSVAELEACVRDGVGLGELATAVPPVDPGSSAIVTHFGGNVALYQAFRASCLQQFRADLIEGERARAAADAPTLRRLAHSLKSVLLTLGHADASALARTLEDSCERSDWTSAAPQWRALSAQIDALR